MQNTQKCLVLGAGATGKAMCAPLFQKMGCAVLFADSDAAACADIARRGGYIVETARGTGLAPREVRGVSAVLPDSEAAESYRRVSEKPPHRRRRRAGRSRAKKTGAEKQIPQ